MANPAPSPVPEGMRTLTMHLWFNGDGRAAVDFYEKAFAAEVLNIEDGPPEKPLMHAHLRLGDTDLMLADAWPGSWEQGAARIVEREPLALRRGRRRLLSPGGERRVIGRDGDHGCILGRPLCRREGSLRPLLGDRHT